MALTMCSECKQQVSTVAKACPHCGAPGPLVPQPSVAPKIDPRSDHVGGGIVFAVFVGLGLFIWWNIGGHGSSLRPASTPPPPVKIETQAEKDKDAGMDAVIAARATVKSMLKDSDSAKFTRQFAVKTGTGAIVACGMVNAKNAFGAYAGESAYVMQDGVVRLESTTNPNNVRRRWNATCAKFPAVYDKPHL